MYYVITLVLDVHHLQFVKIVIKVSQVIICLQNIHVFNVLILVFYVKTQHIVILAVGILKIELQQVLNVLVNLDYLKMDKDV